MLASNSDYDEVAVFHEQLVEPIQLTLYTPQPNSTVVTPSPTVTQPSPITMTSSIPRSYGRGGSVSRDRSPTPTQRYPRPPPNMIISPAHRRSLSADRTHYSSALLRLAKRLSDVIDIDDDVIKRGGGERATGNDVGMSSASAGDGRKPVVTSSAGAPNSRLSRWTATLPALFRKKGRRAENKPASSASRPATTTVVARPLQDQCASLSSGDVMASALDTGAAVLSNLSHSQPLHYGTAPAPVAAAPPPASRGSKLARIIKDPLKLRRPRPSSSSADLPTTSEVSSPRQLMSVRSGTRRARYSLTGAYMQGSL